MILTFEAAFYEPDMFAPSRAEQRRQYTHLALAARIWSVIPLRIDELREDLRLQVDEFLAQNPDSFVARLRPRLIKEGKEHWWAAEGEDLERGVAGFGCSIREALENFERNYRLMGNSRSN
jgi:hypothetical protein